MWSQCAYFDNLQWRKYVHDRTIVTYREKARKILSVSIPESFTEGSFEGLMNKTIDDYYTTRTKEQENRNYNTLKGNTLLGL